METLKDRIGYLGVVAFGVTAFALTIGLVAESAMFPRIVSSAIAVLGLILFVRSFKSAPPKPATEMVIEPAMAIPAGDIPLDPSEDTSPHTGLFINPMRFAIVFLISIAYAICVGTLGYYTATVLLIPIASFCLGLRSPLLIAVTTIVFVGSTYFFFAIVFKLPLTPELLFDTFR